MAKLFNFYMRFTTCVFFLSLSSLATTLIQPKPRIGRASHQAPSENIINNMYQTETTDFFDRFFKTLFVQRDSLSAFREFTTFDDRDDTDSKVIREDNLFGKIPVGMDNEYRLRYRAYVWDYALAGIYLSLGTYALKAAEAPMQIENFQNIVSESFAKSGSSYDDLNVEEVDAKTFKAKVDRLERFVKVLNEAISNKINQEVYVDNIAKIKATIKIQSSVLRNREYHALTVRSLGPNFSFLATKKNGSLKIIFIAGDI